MGREKSLDTLALPLEPDLFLCTLIRELAGVLEAVVGDEEAPGYVSVVAQNMGEWLNGLYRHALGTEKLSREEVAAVLVDLKTRIRGGFFIVERNEDRIVLGNTRCPFTDKVVGRPSLCMMTSNIFGLIAAENLGYARVVLHETIARGGSGCRVTVHLNPTPGAMVAEGLEYFRTETDGTG